jgi:hypothetical protein
MPLSVEYGRKWKLIRDLSNLDFNNTKDHNYNKFIKGLGIITYLYNNTRILTNL